MNNDVIVGCNGKQMIYAKVNLFYYTYLGLDFELDSVLVKLIERAEHPMVKPVLSELIRYAEILKTVKRIGRYTDGYSNQCNIPKTLGPKMSPEDYQYETSHNLDKFLNLYDLIYEAKEIEEKVQELVNKNKNLIAQNKSFIQTFLKTKDVTIGVNYRDRGEFTGSITANKEVPGQYHYSSSTTSKTPIPELTAQFNSWLQKNKEDKAKISDVTVSYRNYYHNFLELGFLNCFEAMHLVSLKMPFTKISEAEVFAQPRNSFGLLTQKEFKFPGESSIYLIILENVNRVPSICYTRKVGSGNNTSVKEVDTFEQSTIFTNLEEAKDFSQRAYSRATTIVKFDIGLKNPEIIMGNNNDFTEKVEARFTKDKLIEILGDNKAGAEPEAAVTPKRNKI